MMDAHHMVPGMIPHPYMYPPQMFHPEMALSMPAPDAQVPQFPLYADPAAQRSIEEQAEFMRQQMQTPYHYEDERLGMDILVPPVGLPQDYVTPYTYYSHSPLHHELHEHDYLHHDPAHSMDHQESKKQTNEDSEYTEFTRYYNNSEQQMKDQIYPNFFGNLV